MTDPQKAYPGETDMPPLQQRQVSLRTGVPVPAPVQQAWLRAGTSPNGSPKKLSSALPRPPPKVQPFPFEQWTYELINDPDRDFLIRGLSNGFDIINSNKPLRSTEAPNHPSAIAERQAVEQQILTEISEGRYVITKDKPLIVSALGAISKAGGGVRLIHDCCKPEGSSVNDHAKLTSVIQYQSVHDATSLITTGCYLCKIDLKNAYRSVPINPAHYQYTGLKWHFSDDNKPTYLYDTRLPFGARLSVKVFHRLSRAVQRILARHGITAVVYLDDFLIVSKSKDAAGTDILKAITILRRLGFSIAYRKVEGPSQKLVFLGIEINSVSQTLHLPAEKIANLSSLLKQFLERPRASQRQLQSLAGKLSWASCVIRGGRTFLRRVLDTMHPLKKPTHKVKLSAEFYADIKWWLSCMHVFNSTSFGSQSRTCHVISTDASNRGAGMTLDDSDWAYMDWEIDLPDVFKSHVNIKECVSAVFAILRWAPMLKDSHVVLLTDNIFTKYVINKNVCRTPSLMP